MEKLNGHIIENYVGNVSANSGENGIEENTSEYDINDVDDSNSYIRYRNISIRNNNENNIADIGSNSVYDNKRLSMDDNVIDDMGEFNSEYYTIGRNSILSRQIRQTNNDSSNNNFMHTISDITPSTNIIINHNNLANSVNSGSNRQLDSEIGSLFANDNITDKTIHSTESGNTETNSHVTKRCNVNSGDTIDIDNIYEDEINFDNLLVNLHNNINKFANYDVSDVNKEIDDILSDLHSMDISNYSTLYNEDISRTLYNEDISRTSPFDYNCADDFDRCRLSNSSSTNSLLELDTSYGPTGYSSDYSDVDDRCNFDNDYRRSPENIEELDYDVIDFLKDTNMYDENKKVKGKIYSSQKMNRMETRRNYTSRIVIGYGITVILEDFEKYILTAFGIVNIEDAGQIFETCFRTDILDAYAKVFQSSNSDYIFITTNDIYYIMPQNTSFLEININKIMPTREHNELLQNIAHNICLTMDNINDYEFYEPKLYYFNLG